FNEVQAASVTDFRAQRLLDEMSAIIGPLSATERATFGPALAAMSAWHAAGDVRQDVARSGTYAHADGISYFDAFYPHVVHAVFNPWFATAQNAGVDDNYCTGNFHSPGGLPKTFDNPPSDGHCYGNQDWSGANVGSSFDGGWQDALDKDFRQVLGAPVAGRHVNTYCGGGHAGATPVQGSLATCRRELLAALQKGISQRQTNFTKLTSNDRLDYRSLGLFGIPTEQWSNKPTYQQFVDFAATPGLAPSSTAPPPIPVASAVNSLPGTGTGVPPAPIAGLFMLLAAGVFRHGRGERRRRGRWG
ncbi:MAG: hypothetical protein M3010_13515, partial [Candidatus Dormibacteraeota bacterium]|nr:hypothetical protein [Candidatus Dormibacteraeota bacterium]